MCFDTIRVKVRDEGLVRNKAVFPKALVQTCIVHLIPYSLSFAFWKERKAIVGVLPDRGATSANRA